MKDARIRAKGFLYFGLWLLVGSLASAFPGFVGPWFAIGILLVMLVWQDRSTLTALNFVAPSFNFQQQPEVGREGTLTVRFEVPPELVEPLGRTRGEMAGHPHLRWLTRGLSFKIVDVGHQLEVVADVSIMGTRVGYTPYPEILLKQTSRSSFWTCSARITTVGGFRVTPPLTKISPSQVQALLTRQRHLLLGKRALVRSRSRDLFHSVREFRYPDPPGHIDPKKSAKLQSLMVRTFEHEAAHHIVLLLDVGRTMLGEVGGSLKYEFYLSALLAIGADAVRNRDMLSLVAFAQKPYLVVRKARTLSALQPILVGAEGVRPREEESNYDMLASIVREIAGQRSIVLLFTDPSRPAVQRALQRSLMSLGREHIVVVLGLIDKGFDLASQISALNVEKISDDKMRALTYAYWLDHEYRRFASRMRGVGVGSILLPEEGWMDAVSRTFKEVRDSLRI